MDQHHIGVLTELLTISMRLTSNLAYQDSFFCSSTGIFLQKKSVSCNFSLSFFLTYMHEAWVGQMQVIMLTYLTVTLTTLGVAHLVDDGLSQKVSRYSTNQLMSLPMFGRACDSCTLVLVEYPLSCDFISSLYEWFSERSLLMSKLDQC